jgi:hypothetical protein
MALVQIPRETEIAADAESRLGVKDSERGEIREGFRDAAIVIPGRELAGWGIQTKPENEFFWLDRIYTIEARKQEPPRRFSVLDATIKALALNIGNAKV